MNKIPRGERIIIGVFGNRNVGKSSLINSITGQEIAIVSDTPGTTTDPVKKAYELIPLGPVIFYDTPGLDDYGQIGELRVKSTKKVIRRTNIAVVVIGENGLTKNDIKVIELIKENNLPVLIAFNKNDLKEVSETDLNYCRSNDLGYVEVSAREKSGIDILKNHLTNLGSSLTFNKDTILGDLVCAGDIIFLVTPIDLSAPKGRLILPQVQVIRDVLDNNCIAVTAKENGLTASLKSLNTKPALVITDSQAIEFVNKTVPKDIKITTFSILFARYKAELEDLVKGAGMIDNLKEDDKILIAEACSHHIESDDIGRFKLPQWLEKFTGKKLDFTFYQGNDYPDNLRDFKLIVHCGGCMLNRKEMCNRIDIAKKFSVPISNYGLTIAKVHNALERCLEIFSKL